ncbi:hypothetical protein Q3H59_003034 [Pantoea sp. SORGH_AS 659]|jgi:hypothetical protein|nr:hypothetical protein [Pantoea sp. SORGH_AS_0659]
MNHSGLLLSLGGRLLVALMLIALLALALDWGMQK